jgi:hypothetical protein
LEERTYQQWIDGIFDHPVTNPAWYRVLEHGDTCEQDDTTNATYLTKLFTECDHDLLRFDDARVGQGLYMIASSSCSQHAFSISSGHAPWPVRRKAIQSIFDLYAKCFAARCSKGLGHLDEVNDPLNNICYMWWDVFPAWVDPSDEAELNEGDEYIAVMERCLSLSHEACLEGALHGLGHWQMNYPERVATIIDRFLRERPDLRPELVVYARRARVGAVL